MGFQRLGVCGWATQLRAVKSGLAVDKHSQYIPLK